MSTMSLSPQKAVGNRFNRLVIIEIPERPADYIGRFWHPVVCRCDCGAVKTIRWASVRNNAITSCGCRRREVSAAKAQTHGGKGTPIFRRWLTMRCRCYQKTHDAYQFYGARGITICDEWQDFVVFRDWALANGFSPGLEIDRINPDLGYSPDNCRFVTHKVNCHNKKKTKFVTAFGEAKTIHDWAEDDRCAPSENTLARRIAKGWDPETALTLPAEKRGHKYKRARN